MLTLTCHFKIPLIKLNAKNDTFCQNGALHVIQCTEIKDRKRPKEMATTQYVFRKSIEMYRILTLFKSEFFCSVLKFRILFRYSFMTFQKIKFLESI